MDNSRNLLPSVVFDNISDGTNAHYIIKDLFKLESWYSYVDERLSYKEYQLPKKADEDLDMLIDWYTPGWNKDWVVNWHPCYSDAVEDVWVRYKGISCGKLLIQFLDKNIVRKHLGELLEYDELYFGLCNRFIHEDWFKFDSI